ncbi:unnamed protein product, partial [Ascophyllum nodosum]
MRSCQGAPSNVHVTFGIKDEILQLPAHKVKRSAAFCSRHPISHDSEWASQPDSGEKLHAQELPAFFHLESTNFVVKSTVGVLSLSML